MPHNSEYASTDTSGKSTKLVLPTSCGLPLAVSAHNFLCDVVHYLD